MVKTRWEFKYVCLKSNRMNNVERVVDTITMRDWRKKALKGTVRLNQKVEIEEETRIGIGIDSSLLEEDQLAGKFAKCDALWRSDLPFVQSLGETFKSWPLVMDTIGNIYTDIGSWPLMTDRFETNKYKIKNWRCGVSIPVPLAC